jgi:hypothetical protein
LQGAHLRGDRWRDRIHQSRDDRHPREVPLTRGDDAARAGYTPHLTEGTEPVGKFLKDEEGEASIKGCVGKGKPLGRTFKQSGVCHLGTRTRLVKQGSGRINTDGPGVRIDCVKRLLLVGATTVTVPVFEVPRPSTSMVVVPARGRHRIG